MTDPYAILLGHSPSKKGRNFDEPSRKGRNMDTAKRFNRQMRRNAGAGGRVAPEVMVKITSFGGGPKDAIEHIQYISRYGNLSLFNSQDQEVSAGKAAFEFIDTLNNNAIHEHANVKRRSMNLMLSMPQGTDQKKFRAAVADFLGNEFGANHDYYYTFHNDSKSGTYHAHAIIAMMGHDFTRIQAKKADLTRWRMDFADTLEDRGIRANATTCLSRNVYSKNSPTYKYHKNIGVVIAHGEAPYKNKPGSGKSYFVTLDSGVNPVTGEKMEKTIWAKGLAKPMQEAEAAGQLLGEVKLYKTKIEYETFKKFSRDENGLTKTEVVDVEKATWAIKAGKDVTDELNKRERVKAGYQRKYLDAWKEVYRRAIEMKDTKAARGIANIVKTHFGIEEKELKKEKKSRSR